MFHKHQLVKIETTVDGRDQTYWYCNKKGCSYSTGNANLGNVQRGEARADLARRRAERQKDVDKFNAEQRRRK